MKSNLTLFFLLFFTLNSHSQNRSKFYHKIKNSDIESGYLKLIYKEGATEKKLKICSKYLKGIISLDKGIPVVDFWTITSDNQYSDSNCITNQTPIQNGGRFEIDLDTRKKIGEPTKTIKVPFRAWTWGVGTTPFRFRPKNDYSASTISSSLGVSINYGRTFGYSRINNRALNNYSITLGPFIGLTSADLKKSTVKDPSIWTIDRTNVALSYGVNAIIARNNFGLVLSLGFDYNFGTDSNKWSYQNKPWVGIGINTGLGIF